MVHKKLRPPVTVLCRKMSAKKIPELYTTSHICLYYAAKFTKKSTRMVHNRLRLRVTVLCSKMSAKQNTRMVQKDNLSLKYYHDKKEMQESNKTQ